MFYLHADRFNEFLASRFRASTLVNERGESLAPGISAKISVSLCALNVTNLKCLNEAASQDSPSLMEPTRENVSRYETNFIRAV
jgi:hypothetical protein